jgi:flagellar hook assembly protein FlgD
VLVGTTDTTLFNNTSGGGIGLMASNRLDVARAGDVVATFNRMTDDGSIIQFYGQGALEGSIDVSGNTVSLVGFSGAHASSGIDVTTAKGTVVSTIDQEHKNNHAKIKVSDSEGDARVYGVIDRISEEGDIIVSGVGIGEVKVTGACAGGDLLESNGDGTAKVQSDDIIRSKTIGKVTIGNGDEGVNLVSCVLYCG